MPCETPSGSGMVIKKIQVKTLKDAPITYIAQNLLLYKKNSKNAHHCVIHSKCAELALIFLNIPATAIAV